MKQALACRQLNGLGLVEGGDLLATGFLVGGGDGGGDNGGGGVCFAKPKLKRFEFERGGGRGGVDFLAGFFRGGGNSGGDDGLQLVDEA